MKFKNLTKDQIIISLDRLTRFKRTEDKYLRVFLDIIHSNLIEPVLKKNEIKNLDYKYITEIVTEIFNQTLGAPNTLDINRYLKEYENSIFVNDKNTQNFLDNNINYAEGIKLLPDNLPVNLKWLKSLLDKEPSTNNREVHLLKFPIEKVLLVEGITEEILLPVFAKFLGYDFYAKGIQIIAAGGKNQVVKMYYKLQKNLKFRFLYCLIKMQKIISARLNPSSVQLIKFIWFPAGSLKTYSRNR